jgi:hypothetical protein
MFSLHYYFKDKETVDGFLSNVADNLKIGGYFVGCCFDGDTVYKKLQHVSEGGTIKDNEQNIWAIRRSYSTMDFLDSTDSGLGKAIDVFFMSIGEEHREYLVSWKYLVNRMNEIGCELLQPNEIASTGLKSSSEMFGESYKHIGFKYVMNSALQEFSFMNRWFIFRRRRESEVVIKEEDVQQMGGGEPNKETTPSNKRPLYKFYHGSVMKDDLMIGMTNWARYISTFAYSKLKDRDDPTVTYPSLEAAFASERFKQSTDRPELGPALFGFTENLHQKYEKRRQSNIISEKGLYDLIEEEGVEIRDFLKPNKMKQLGATWNESNWNKVREEIMFYYIKQRYDTDANFKLILDKLKALNANIVYYNGNRPSDMGGIIRDNGTIDGKNKLGSLYMAVVGLEP